MRTVVAVMELCFCCFDMLFKTRIMFINIGILSIKVVFRMLIVKI